MLKLTMMYLRSFLGFAWPGLIILFLSAGCSCYSGCRSASKAHHKGSLQLLREKVPNNWTYERHRTCTKLKGRLRKLLLLASDAQKGTIGYHHGNVDAFLKSFAWPQRFVRLDFKHAKQVLSPMAHFFSRNMYFGA
jgi:hypothetical protein